MGSVLPRDGREAFDGVRHCGPHGVPRALESAAHEGQHKEERRERERGAEPRAVRPHAWAQLPSEGQARKG